MFQSFESFSEGDKGGERLENLRAQMAANNLDAYLIPHADEFQNEYPPQYAWRLAWLTGFTGSAGFAIAAKNEAVVFSDGRYTIQLSSQIDSDHFITQDLTNCPPAKWLANKLASDSNIKRVGYDPNLITLAQYRSYKKHLKSYDVELVPLDNLIDEIWIDQPAVPLEPVNIHDIEVAGELARDKITRIQKIIEEKKANACLISDPASIAWCFNIRGGDTPHTPLTLAQAIIPASGFPLLFIDKRKLSNEVEAYLTQLADLHPPNRLDEELAKISADASIMVDPARTSVALADIITGNEGKLVEATDPIVLPRAIKNKTEIEGSRAAHLHDGVALTRFLYWLDQQQPGKKTEIDAAKTLEEYRAKTAEVFQSKLLDSSFDTISGAGANGAIVHYRVTTHTNATLEDGSLYLVDSGGQYRDGTTDITRTIAIGKPPEGSIKDFTLVLKGHIAIAEARFPIGTRGIDLDPLARIALWQNGRDYAHGTGHGIGSYLSVHEGPQSISRRGMAELKPGMIISNEPGYYREGQYGIRIENLVLVSDPLDIENGNIPVMGFETLSMAPIDLDLVDPTLLTDAERHWLNAYHGWVYREISPHLEADEVVWLKQNTRPISLELPAASA